MADKLYSLGQCVQHISNLRGERLPSVPSVIVFIDSYNWLSSEPDPFLDLIPYLIVKESEYDSSHIYTRDDICSPYTRWARENDLKAEQPPRFLPLAIPQENNSLSNEVEKNMDAQEEKFREGYKKGLVEGIQIGRSQSWL
jgi:hypothetical protein